MRSSTVLAVLSGLPYLALGTAINLDNIRTQSASVSTRVCGSDRTGPPLSVADLGNLTTNATLTPAQQVVTQTIPLYIHLVSTNATKNFISKLNTQIGYERNR
jgi:hypothetical protein